MNKILTSMSGVMAICLSGSAVSFAEGGDTTTKTTITQTTKVTQEKGSPSFLSRIKNLATFATGAVAAVGYSIFSAVGVALLAETVGLTKVAENYLGIAKEVAQTVIASSGMLGATSAVIENFVKN